MRIKQIYKEDKKKQSKKLLEKLCNGQYKTGKIFDSFDLNMKSIDCLTNLKCGHENPPEGKKWFASVKI